jgi:hypothetical protein
VTNLDLGVSYPSGLTSEPTHHMDTDADWDAVGNLYYLDDWPGCWRAFSPPGANQATTVARAQVQVIPSVQAPSITSVGVAGGWVTIHFTGGSSDPAWAFVLLSASVAAGPYSPVADAIITGSGGSFVAMTHASSSVQFYRVERLATIPVRITSMLVAGNVVTITFTGPVEDAASAFTLLSSGTVNGSYTAAPGASISALSPGLFQATVAPSGPRQYYRIRR